MWVSSTLRSGSYVVEVSDNGPGISKRDRKLIFEKFWRGVEGSGDQGGAGLGLAISRQIIARMSGSLELVQGNSPGACFRVKLPIVGKRG